MLKNRGGSRPNSGRKPSGQKKKQAKQIYISNELEQKINDITLPNCHSFSKKCAWLLEKGIGNMEKEMIQAEKSNVVRFIDLFAGLGGIRLGFENALQKQGLIGKSVFVSEIKKSAVQTYKENFDNEEITGDITKVNARDIPDFDYVLAGFPCQAFSSAGNRLGFEDTRGTLFFDVARIIKEKRPKGFLLENVEGLVNHDHGKTFKVIYNTLIEMGYSVSYRVLSSADFGTAQNRKRIYIVGNRDGKKIELSNFNLNKDVLLKDIIEYDVPAVKDDFSQKLLSEYSIKNVEGKSIKDKRGGKNNIHSWDFSLKGKVSTEQKRLLDLLLKQRRNKKWADIIGIDWMDGMPLTEKMIRTFYDKKELHSMLEDLVAKGYLVYEFPKKKIGNRRVYDDSLEKGYNIVTGKLSFKYSKILSPNEKTPTLVATDVSHLAVPVKDGLRKITLRESLRLFGFPESYKIDAKSLGMPKAYDLLGNTVCVPVIEAVAEKLIQTCEFTQ